MLNKRQRLSHYKKALKMIETYETEFICCALGNINSEVDKLYDFENPDKYIEYLNNNYPEFMSFKPKNVKMLNSWWSWKSARGYNTRIKVLNKCIEMCKPKQK